MHPAPISVRNRGTREPLKLDHRVQLPAPHRTKSSRKPRAGRLAVKSLLPLGLARCRGTPEGGHFGGAVGSACSPAGTPFPTLGSGKIREGSVTPRTHLPTGGGEDAAAVGKGGQPAAGCPSAGGAGISPQPRRWRSGLSGTHLSAERREGPDPRQVPAPCRSCFICTGPRSDWPGRLP